LRAAILRGGNALSIDNPWRPQSWLFRIFIRPDEPDPGRVEQLLVHLINGATRLLGMLLPHTWFPRLFLRPENPDLGPPPGSWQRLKRHLLTFTHAVRTRLPSVNYPRIAIRLEKASSIAWLQNRFVRTGVAIVGIFGFWLSITTPMDWRAQLTFDVFLGMVAILVRNTPGTITTLWLMALSLIASCRYGWWRLTQSLDLNPGWESVIGYALLAAEFYAWIMMILGFIQCAWPLKRQPVALPADPGVWPTVDVYIPTYNEPVIVVRPTILAARNLDWPKDRLNIYLLDDGRRDSMRELADETGVFYMARPDNQHAKAGNLNYALARTKADYIAIFDCDHLAVRSFLHNTMGTMLADPGCGMVQTPHHFFSPDPFERNLKTFRRVPNEGSLFHGLVQDGNDFWNAAFFCGSCAVLRRDALNDIGGVAVETVTEDAHTALKMHRLGYRTAYINLTQAAGLATESLSQHVAQRVRWARGMAQIWRIDNPLLGKGLSLMQRLCYSNSMLHFFYGIPRMIFLTAPLAYLYFDMHIIRSPALIFALYLLPHLVLPHVTTAHVQKAYRHSFWAEVYETVLAWYVTLPTLLAFFSPKRGHFNVTAKGQQNLRARLDWGISQPYLVLVVLNVIGLVLGVVRLTAWNRFEPGTVIMNLLWTAFNLLMLGAAIGVAHERRQVRGFHRVEARLPVTLVFANGHTQRCQTSNFSLNGLGLRLSEPTDLADHEPLRVLMEAGDKEYSFGVRVTSQRGISAGVQFTDTSHQQQEQLIACTFGRTDAWANWHEQYEPDRPLKGLGEILTNGLLGYGDLVLSVIRELRRRSGQDFADPPSVKAGR
jgi:cellulose synthase (UDP-forming)